MKSIFSIKTIIIAALFGAFIQVSADEQILSLTEETYHVEVLVESTHVSENTTSTSWQSVLSSDSEPIAEWYYGALVAEDEKGDIYHLLFDPSPVYDQEVIDIRIRTEKTFRFEIAKDFKKVTK